MRRFDFLDPAEHAREHQLEQALIDDVQRFLLELGAGFAFYGRQRPLRVGRQEVYPDLLFYHHTLRRFVVLELKVGRRRRLIWSLQDRRPPASCATHTP